MIIKDVCLSVFKVISLELHELKYSPILGKMHNNFHYLTIIQNSWHILPSSWTIIFVQFLFSEFVHCFLFVIMLDFLIFSFFYNLNYSIYLLVIFLYSFSAVRTGYSPGWFTAIIPCLGFTDLNTLYCFLNTLSSFLHFLVIKVNYTLIFLVDFFYNKDAPGDLGILQKFHVW